MWANGFWANGMWANGVWAGGNSTAGIGWGKQLWWGAPFRWFKQGRTS